MQTEQEFYETARDIISFADSYVQNKQRKQNEQSEYESIQSLVEILVSLKCLRNQIWKNNNMSKQMIQIPKLLRSLSALSLYKISTHIDLGVDRQSLEVRSWSRTCLIYIQYYGDEQAQQELVNNGYGRVIFISYSTAGGIDEVQDAEIWNGLKQISRFLSELHFGRYNHKPFFQPLPLLARMSVEQIEEEGANEEVEAQMNNVGYYDDSNIKDYANYVKAMVLNHFVHSR